SAGVATLTGVGFTPLRLVSLIASLGSAVFVYVLVSRDAQSRVAGVLAAGLLLGTTQLPGESLTTVRVDALCLLFLMAAIYTARLVDRQPGSASRLSALSGVLVALSVLTKQTAAVVALALLVLALPQP